MEGEPRKRRKARLVFYPRKRCDECGGVNLRACRGKSESPDKVTTQYLECVDCDCLHEVVEEMSINWNHRTGQTED